MLHTGILPHHTNWSDFLPACDISSLMKPTPIAVSSARMLPTSFARLKRVANFYGARPQFILASATIGNPRELAERLIEEPVHLIDNDGSARGPRHFIIYNPPITDQALGLRKSSLLEGVRLAQDLLNQDVQSVVFARSRRSVEIILRYLQENQASSISRLQSSNLQINDPASAATARATFPSSAGKSKRDCAKARSKPWSPRTPSSWDRYRWAGRGDPRRLPGNRRVSAAAGGARRTRAGIRRGGHGRLCQSLSISSSPIIRNIFSSAPPSRRWSIPIIC